MTNTQLLLLATNNINNNITLSHSQSSYVYQYYHTNIANKYTSLNEFLPVFIQQTAPTLEGDPSLNQQSARIYAEIECYLKIAETHFLQRQMQLQK